MSELETREFRAEANEDGTFEGIAVPYGQVFDAGSFKERFERGAFEGSADVKVYRDHKEIIGHVIETEDREEGFWIKAKIAATDLGRNTLELLRSGALSKLSVGFIPGEHRDEDGVIVRSRASLREVSVVERPAYSLANILSVREEPTESEPLDNTKEEAVTDTAPNADLTEVRNQVEELEQRFAMFTPAPAAEKVETRSAAELLKAIVAGDAEAVEVYERAYTGGTTADAPRKNAWVGDLTDIFDASSGLLNSIFATGTLPAKGNVLEFAELNTNTMVFDKQVNEGDDLAFGKVTLRTRTAEVFTYGGATQLSRQAIERSDLPLLQRNLEALSQAAGARKKAVLRAEYDTLVAARRAIASDAGVVALGKTLATGTADDWENLLIDASIRYESLNATPQALLVSGDVFKKMRSLTVTGERVFTVADGNHSGSINLRGLVGSFAGLPVYLDPAASAGSAVFVHGDAMRTYDSALVSLQDENIINLSKDFSAYRYGAVAAEKPQLIVPVKFGA